MHLGTPQASAQSKATTSKLQPFRSGEALYYHVRYSFAKGAEVVFRVSDTVINGRTYFHLQIEGKTTGMVGLLYPLHDSYHSYTSQKTILPVMAIRNVHEQSYRDYKVDRFDRTTRSDSTILTRENGSQHVLPRDVYDLVSLGYALRVKLSQTNYTTGSVIAFPTFFNAEYFPLAVRYLGEEKVKTDFGKIRCHKFVPRIQKGELFKENDAVSIWFSTDRNHLPVRIEFKLFLGSMVCELKRYQNLTSTFPVP